MALYPGQQFGSYEITALLGKGGMGEVYRARDAKLKREVAIKILSDEFAGDADRVSRFQREAELLASLNHPHIAVIHDFAAVGNYRYLVLELIEGETLADRVAQGPIPIDETLAIAKQIAEAVEAAHEKGIVHRDLKPANIKITPAGTVKVLDFGLAKMRAIDAIVPNLSNSPTLMTAPSAAGVILGTAAYMSPEQAKGKEVDRTADVWAFGCVLYEMLTGRAVFEGETIGEVIGGVFKSDPDWSRLPAETPESIRRLLRRCLRKDLKLRLRDIGDAAIEIAEAREEPKEPRQPQKTRPLSLAGGVGILVVIAMLLTVLMYFRVPPPEQELRLELNTPPTSEPGAFAISPDGKQIVYEADSDKGPTLWLRKLDSLSARPLPGTGAARCPFWSPDGRSVGFFADGKLKRIDIDGGAIRDLAAAPYGVGGAWNSTGTIIFTSNRSRPLERVSAGGGEVTQLTKIEVPRINTHRNPQFLSDGEHFLFFAQGTTEKGGVYVGSLNETASKRLLDADSAASYLAPGLLVFLRQGGLFAQIFDSDQLQLKGDPFPVVEGSSVAKAITAFSTSAVGTIVYRSSGAQQQKQLMWFDRTGKKTGTVGEAGRSGHPSLSPNGQHVALDRSVDKNNDIWTVNVATGLISRLTFSDTVEIYPIWSADGSRIFFSSDRKGKFDLFSKSANGNGSEEALLTTSGYSYPDDTSADGRFLLYHANLQDGNIWALPLDKNGKAAGEPLSIVREKFNQRNGQFSPDSKWIAYQSDESGRTEIFLQQFPTAQGKWQISTNGGRQPRWRHDGKELFYIAPDDQLMTVPIQLSADGQGVEHGVPMPLFELHIGGVDEPMMDARDGQHFLVLTNVDDTPSPLTIMLNWKHKQ